MNRISPMQAATLSGWRCASTPPGRLTRPDEVDGAGLEWYEASVPGTVAGTLRDAGRWAWGSDDEGLLDGRDWWYRCRFDAPAPGPGPWELQLDGLATLADVWCNGAHVLRSENMFLAHRVPVELREAGNELAMRFAALGPVLAARHPRPRWKSRLVRTQSLRWYRTSLLGRMPGWSPWAAAVGPWRPVRLVSAPGAGAAAGAATFELHTACDPAGRGGTISVRVKLPTPPEAEVRVHAAGAAVTLEWSDAGEAHGTLALERVERWWPHSHGAQPLYDVELELDGARARLRRVGFRTVELDRAGDGFRVLVNGLPIFCRGAVWVPPDAVSFAAPADEVRDAVVLARDAGMNMLRIAGYGAYEGEAFWDACDELGVLVWQDAMLASTDPPDDVAFAAQLEPELRQVFGAYQGRPSLAVACGSSETYQQAAMFGLPRERYRSELLERTIPDVLADVIPGVPYLPSSPSGGEPPFSPDAGVSHFFGIGAFLRPATDARLARVRFASETLAFGIPPERETVDEAFGGAGVAGHSPRWKRTVAYDNGSSWDYEDVRDHYVRELFETDPLRVRYSDPERALDLGRAAVAEVMSAALSEWRRPSNCCDGAVVLMWRDLWPGAGWGVLDCLGRPKAPFYALKRAFAPTTVLVTDEALLGLWLHVIHDGPGRFEGTLQLRAFGRAGEQLEGAEREVDLDPHGAVEIRAETLMDGFRDLNYAYRFAAPVYDAIVVDLLDEGGTAIAQACHAVGGPARPRLPELGLTAHAAQAADGAWSLAVSTSLFAHYVCVETPGFRPEDSWFHLAPGASRTIGLYGPDRERRPSGSLRALNCTKPAHIVLPEPA
jgi:beta-mannosidase